MPDFRDFGSFRYQGPARVVRGGIKAQNKRGAFGKSWWGRRWLETLESFSLAGRLDRGKSYARKGQVIDLEVAEGTVTASVQGSRKEPYAVRIEMKTIPQDVWEALARNEFNQALVAAQMLSGTMPEQTEEIFKKRGLYLFPQKKDDLKTDCSCPDYSNPCKHIAAVYFLLAEEFDREPFLIFKLRGQSRVALLKSMFSALERDDKLSGSLSRKKKNEVSASPAANDTGESAEPEIGSAVDLEQSAANKITERQSYKKVHFQPELLPSDPAKFWQHETVAESLTPPAILPHINAQTLKAIGSPPFWRADENFLEAMSKIYAEATKRAAEILSDE
jgi:uncharacterized Zn finger protein